MENNEEIKDPAGLLKAYREAVEDLKTLREENKALTDAAAKKPVEENEWKTRAIKAEAKIAIADTGVKDVDRLMNYINLEGVDYDDEGNLVGLDDKVNGLKTDLPELFDVKRKVGGKADIFANNAADSPPTASEIAARQLGLA